MISLYEGAKTRVRVDSEAKLSMQQGSVHSPSLLAVVADVVIELATEGVLSELLYADDIVLMNERNKFSKWKDAFGSKG